MSRMVSRGRIAQVTAVVLGLLLLAMGALGVVLDRLTHYPGNGGPLVDSLATAAAAVPAASVATLLAARRPRNPIGWLLFAILFVGANPSGQYDVWAYRMHPGTVPFGWVAVVIQELWPLFLVLIAILLWVFPDGRLPGGRWRRPSAILVVGGLLLGGAESLSGVVRVARHDVRITANGDLVGSSGVLFSIFAFTPDHRGAVQPGAAAGAAGGGPALQPVPVRRRGAGGRVHRAAAAHRGPRRRP